MDTRNQRIKRGRWFIVVLIILFSLPAMAGMSLVSTSPADGDVAVSTSCNLTLTFNSPVDTLAIYYFNHSDFYLNISIYPTDKLYSLDSITFSPDMKTVNFHNLQLETDTKYVIILSGAKNTAGEVLDAPSVITFTTGASLPAGSVSGKVTFNGGDPTNTVVELVLYYASGPQTSAAVVIHDVDGNYTIPYVTNNSYACTANKDLNQDGIMAPDSGDALGIYDADSNHLPDNFNVNGAVTGIDFQMQQVPAVTASFPFFYLDSVIRQSGTDYQLIIVEGLNVTQTGQSRSWLYMYYVPNTAAFFYFYAYGDILFMKYIIPTTDVVTPVGTTWIDSDAALILAENAGGNEFRANYPDCEIMAFLCSEDLLVEQFSPNAAGNNPIDAMKKFASPKPKARDHQPHPHSNTNMAVNTAYWIIDYYSNQTYESLTIYINAENGTILQPQTAGADLNNVSNLAQTAVPDAQLVQIFTPEGNYDGSSMTWIYRFISRAQGKLYEYETMGPLVLSPKTTNTYSYPPPLPASWVDSDAAFAIAENSGGSDFRNRYPDTEIWANLNPLQIVETIFPAKATIPIQNTEVINPYYLNKNGLGDDITKAQNQAYWFINYWSGANSKDLLVGINAVTGSVLEPASAQSSLESAYEFALTWSSDVVLAQIDSNQDTLNNLGAAESWSYYFYSASRDSDYIVVTFNGAIRYFGAAFAMFANTGIPGGWMDSDAAMLLTENNGGSDFRAQHDSVRVRAYLYPGITPGGAIAPYWCFNYSSGTNYLVLSFNAVTGEFPNTGIVPEEQKLPSSQRLYQNYPNPFNPETVISYEIPQQTHVKVSVYDVLGRKVAVLVDEEKDAGVYHITWKGTDNNGFPLANGIYFYELAAGSGKQVKQMLLIK